MTTFVEIVSKDVLAFLEKNNELLFNERDFQMHLATWLRTSSHCYDDVDVEYYVPWQVLDNYVWKSELRLDIVVKKDNQYCPIELKYKTKKVERPIMRFDEQLDKIIVMKNQGAQDLGMYDFWKDIRRLELIRNRFEKVIGGLAVFVTNDIFYTKGSRATSNNHLFSMVGETVHSRQKHWLKSESVCARNYPNFEVDEEYSIDWHQRTIDKEEFYYCIVTI